VAWGLREKKMIADSGEWRAKTAGLGIQKETQDQGIVRVWGDKTRGLRCFAVPAHPRQAQDDRILLR
jgi:hypothetical protein